MAYFDEGFVAWFRAMAKHNKREWYHANKKEYERHVKLPFEEFCEELLHRMAAKDRAYAGVDVKKAMFRIARDIRFSKDKTPYKTHMSAALVPGGKRMETPGFYVQLGANGLAMAAGLYQPEKDQITAVRRALVKDSKTLKRLLKAKAFKDRFGGLQGEKNKRLPPEFQEAAESEPLLYHKQFYWWVEFKDPKQVLRADLDRFVLAHWEAGRAVSAWFTKAVG